MADFDVSGAEQEWEREWQEVRFAAQLAGIPLPLEIGPPLDADAKETLKTFLTRFLMQRSGADLADEFKAYPDEAHLFLWLGQSLQRDEGLRYVSLKSAHDGLRRQTVTLPWNREQVAPHDAMFLWFAMLVWTAFEMQRSE
jgi:hypothetical protein